MDISKEVKLLLKKYAVKDGPIDVFKIIEDEGINLSYEILDDDWSGFCMRNPKESRVVLNKKHHINRQRFTASHELGHLILHCSHGKEEVFVDKTVAYNRDQASSSGEIKREIEANKFAAELLMPESFIIKDLKDKKDSISYEDIEDLALKYEVSERAMSIRIERLTKITFF